MNILLELLMLRNGIPADAEQIEKVRIAAWRLAYQDFMPENYLAELEAQINIDGLQQRLAVQNIDFSLTVAEIGPLIVGFMILGKPRYEAPKSSIELWALNVHPNYWRKGIGRELTQKAIDLAIAAKFQHIQLWCIKSNLPAEAAYKCAGFISTGKERTSSNLTGHPIHERQYTKKL